MMHARILQTRIIANASFQQQDKVGKTSIVMALYSDVFQESKVCVCVHTPRARAVV
jgi:hypothetical protein